MRCETTHNVREWTCLALSLLGLEPNGDGDRRRRNTGKKSRAANIGGRVIGHDVVAPVIPHGSSVPNGEIEALGETHWLVCMAARRVHSAAVIGRVGLPGRSRVEESDRRETWVSG